MALFLVHYQKFYKDNSKNCDIFQQLELMLNLPRVGWLQNSRKANVLLNEDRKALSTEGSQEGSSKE